MRQLLFGLISVFSIGLLLAPSANAQYSAVNDFSIAGNPNGNWQYGRTSGLGSTFSLLTISDMDGTEQLARWYAGGLPLVAKNTTGGTVTLSSFTMPNDVLQMHPGADDAYAVVRFIVPASGQYTINGRFQALDATSTDVHVLINGSSQFDGSIDGLTANPDPATSNRTSFSLTRMLAAGDTVDFAVGPRGGFNSDSTGLLANIDGTSAAPEPASLALLALTGASVAGLIARRRK